MKAKRTRRTGATATFSESVDARTKGALRALADAAFAARRGALVLFTSALVACGGAPLTGRAPSDDAATAAALVETFLSAREARALEVLDARARSQAIVAVLGVADENDRRTAAYDFIVELEMAMANDPVLGRPGLVVVAGGDTVISRNLDRNRMFGSRLEEPHAVAAAGGQATGGIVSMSADGWDLSEDWARVAMLAAVPIPGLNGPPLGVIYAAWPLRSLAGFAEASGSDLVLIHGSTYTTSLDDGTTGEVARAVEGRGGAAAQAMRATLGSPATERALVVGTLADAPAVRWVLVTRDE